MLGYIRSLFFLVALIGLFMVYSVLAPLLILFSGDLRKAYTTMARLWSRQLLGIAGIRVTCRGVENIPPGEPCILVSNHQSMMDIFICFAYIPRPIGFFAKKALFKIPYYGWVLKKSGSLPVERDDARKDLSMLGAAAAVIRQGQDVVIYPEGTRSGQATLTRFKRGCLVLASKAQVPIIPTAIKDSYKTVTKGSLKISPGNTVLSFGQPVKVPEELSKQGYMGLLTQLEQTIAGMLVE